MTKREYPGFLLWWQDKNHFPLAVQDDWQPWYLWPEEGTDRRDPGAPTVPVKWLESTESKLHRD